jgi:hypothetical protein
MAGIRHRFDVSIASPVQERTEPMAGLLATPDQRKNCRLNICSTNSRDAYTPSLTGFGSCGPRVMGFGRSPSIWKRRGFRVAWIAGTVRQLLRFSGEMGSPFHSLASPRCRIPASALFPAHQCLTSVSEILQKIRSRLFLVGVKSTARPGVPVQSSDIMPVRLRVGGAGHLRR